MGDVIHEKSPNSEAKSEGAMAVLEKDGPDPALSEMEQGKEDLVAWLQVLGAFSLNLNTWGLMNAFGVFQTYYKLSLFSSHSSSDISWIGSVQAFLMFLTSMIAGAVFDAGYLQPLLWIGTLLTVLGMFMTSLCKEYWQAFLAQGVMMGIGFGCIYLPAPAIVSQHFDKRRALAIGMSSTGSAVGGVIYPIIFTQLQPSIGFGWATRVIAFIILGTSLVHLAVMKSLSQSSVRRSLLDHSALRDIPYILLTAGLFFGVMGLYIILYYIQLYALQNSSISSTLASYLLVIMNACSLPGRLITGFYADKIGSINTQILLALVSALLTYCLVAITSAAGLVVYSVLYGMSSGAFMGLPAAGIARLSEDHSKIGIRIGMSLAVIGLGMLVSTPIAGAILAGSGGWTGLIVWCGTLLAAASACLIASKIAKVGPGLGHAI